jgi:hypothetical protein
MAACPKVTGEVHRDTLRRGALAVAMGELPLAGVAAAAAVENIVVSIHAAPVTAIVSPALTVLLTLLVEWRTSVDTTELLIVQPIAIGLAGASDGPFAFAVKVHVSE